MITLIHDIAAQLQAAYPRDEAEALAWWIAEETTGLSRSQILTGCKITKNFAYTQEISAANANLQEKMPKNWQEIINRLLHFEPIQYIFGHTLWCGLDLKVTPATLIPRPETAELVETISNFKFQISNIPVRVLDVGTGSGCIAIALKKMHPEWKVTGIDISAEAIEVAKENAQRNGVEVSFLQMDILSDKNGVIEPFSGIENEVIEPFDIIVSNPPYICEKEKKDMRRNVLDFEPASALFVPDEDPLIFYRRIAELHWGKYVFFEINEAYPAELSAVLSTCGYSDIRTTNDSYGKPRIIQARSTR